MTMEEYGKAQSIVERIHRCQENIDAIRHILSSNPDIWGMVICPPYPNGNVEHKIVHCGLLKEFLEKVLMKHEEELERLYKQIAEI